MYKPLKSITWEYINNNYLTDTTLSDQYLKHFFINKVNIETKSKIKQITLIFLYEISC